MDWFKDFIKNLPLDLISEIVTRLTLLWSKLVEDVPDEDLPLITYIGSSALVLALLLLIVRVLPRPIGGILWMLAVSVLLTPGDTLADSESLSPAIAHVAHRILLGDTSGAMTAFLPILAVFTVLLFIGTIWQILRGTLEAHAKKHTPNS